MVVGLIHDRGRGPEIEGTRITIDDLLPHFLEPDETESSICQRYDLTPEQVSAARAYILSEPDLVLGRFLRLQDRMAAGNPPDVVEKAEKTRATLLSFREWLARRQSVEDHGPSAGEERVRTRSQGLPTFKEWLAEGGSRPAGGS